jgi:hypothetical protein
LERNEKLFSVGWGKPVAANKGDRNVEVVIVVRVASSDAVEGKLVYVGLLSDLKSTLNLRC